MATDKITDLPLFPLNTVLFPRGLLPLQIFEVRYLHMVAKCQREASPFGVVSLIQGSEVRKADEAPDGAEVFQSLGTLARIAEFAAPMPGLMKIKCIGEQRFRILRQAKLTHGLWVAEVSRIAADKDVAIPADLLHVAEKLGRLIRNLQARGVRSDEMPISPPYELGDCAWVANRWSELLPVSAAMKRDLLATDSPVLRLELIGDVLDRTILPI